MTTNKQLVSVSECLTAVFPNHAVSGPSIRLFRKWQSQRLFPVHKIGGRVFLNAEEVQTALERRFKINAVEAR